jgi:SfnB family sulfur acquisition oxidoreductase
LSLTAPNQDITAMPSSNGKTFLPIAAKAAARQHARIITSDDEAITVASELAESFALNAASRDRERSLPFEEIDAYSNSGLWAVTIPREYGGAGVSYKTLAKVIGIVSAADGSLGQIPQNHFFLLEALRWAGTPEQKQFLFERVLAGDRLGNALAELGTANANATKTVIRRDGDDYRLDGRKYYCSGVIFADWIVPSVADEDDGRAFVFLAADTSGVSVVDDWNGFGQRTTASGTTVFENVAVHRHAIIPTHPPSGWSLSNPVAHIMHAAIDAGTARAAIDATISFVRDKARPWADSGITNAWEDPHTVLQIGEAKMRLHAAEALIERAGGILDAVAAEPGGKGWAQASVAVSEAKMAAADIALLASSKLIELGGASATRGDLNLDRFWRNARTHTVHDPIRWRAHEVGNYWLNGRDPPNHAVKSRGATVRSGDQKA